MNYPNSQILGCRRTFRLVDSPEAIVYGSYVLWRKGSGQAWMPKGWGQTWLSEPAYDENYPGASMLYALVQTHIHCWCLEQHGRSQAQAVA